MNFTSAAVSGRPSENFTSSRKSKRKCGVDHAPALSELGLQARVLIGAQERIVNQVADAHGVGVGGVAGIELKRITFDADD